MNNNSEIVDLDRIGLGDLAEDDPSAECECGVLRTNLRYWEVSRCASRAMARLRDAHRPEYDKYLAELKAEAVAVFEAKWQQHQAGNHRPK